jgi:hypothetical protein
MTVLGCITTHSQHNIISFPKAHTVKTKTTQYTTALKPRVPPALFLFFLSPIIGELLSGSAPPTEFFTPLSFTIITLLYGGGAVITRELKTRWHKGIGTTLLLGAAYGILEEGLMIASFQNPNHPDLGALGVFGRYLGVNWVWAVELTIYHAIASITIPILLTEYIYPQQKTQQWLTGRWKTIVPTLFTLDVTIGFVLFTQFNNFIPPLPMYSLFIAATLALAYAAHRLPADWARRGIKPMRNPRYYYTLTFLGAMSLGFIFGVLPQNLTFTAAPITVAILGITLQLSILKHLASYNWHTATRLHYHRLLFGSLSPFILFSYLQELDQTRIDNTTGMALVGTLFLIAFLVLGRNQPNKEPQPITDIN